jgi:phytoene desaturase
MYHLVEALISIAKKSGARFIYNAPVQRINVNGHQATGITMADGREITADVIVANADLPYVYRHLLRDSNRADRLRHKKYTSSTVSFFWGVDKQYPQLGAHNLFIASDFRKSMEHIFRDLTLPDEPSFYLHAPVRIDTTLAPEGQDTLTAVVPVGNIDDTTQQDWGQIRERARQSVFQRLAEMGISDIEEHIKFEVCYTPPDWLSRYNLTRGSSFGLSHTFLQMGFLRPQNRHASYRNLFFVGASTHPGAGLPTVLVSARLTTERILEMGF